MRGERIDEKLLFPPCESHFPVYAGRSFRLPCFLRYPGFAIRRAIPRKMKKCTGSRAYQ